MRKSKRFDRQIDDLLFTAATALGTLYARRRARRVGPKVLAGAGVVAVGTAIGVAALGAGALGLAGGTAVWYRRRSKTSTATDPWQTPPRSSFVDKDPRAAASAATE
jgi:hypothetical protein